MLERDGWQLRPAVAADFDELMRWVPDEQSVKVWGGPNFRFPYDRDSFVADCHWPEMPSYALCDPEGQFAAFGQFYNRHERINLARLIAHPNRRGEGIGQRLVRLLMEIGAGQFELDEFSLYVYRDNAPALNCYQGLGFEIQDYPKDDPLAEVCYYLTRPVGP